MTSERAQAHARSYEAHSRLAANRGDALLPTLFMIASYMCHSAHVSALLGPDAANAEVLKFHKDGAP